MSGKRHKALRRLARAATVGLPATGWFPAADRSGRRTHARVHPRTTRGVVKQLKRAGLSAAQAVAERRSPIEAIDDALDAVRPTAAALAAKR